MACLCSNMFSFHFLHTHSTHAHSHVHPTPPPHIGSSHGPCHHRLPTGSIGSTWSRWRTLSSPSHSEGGGPVKVSTVAGSQGPLLSDMKTHTCTVSSILLHLQCIIICQYRSFCNLFIVMYDLCVNLSSVYLIQVLDAWIWWTVYDHLLSTLYA